MTATRQFVVPGNWASPQGGKWHLIGNAPDTLREIMLRHQTVTSECGVAFEPLNVTGGEAPQTNDHWICKKCRAHLAPIGVEILGEMYYPIV